MLNYAAICCRLPFIYFIRRVNKANLQSLGSFKMALSEMDSLAEMNIIGNLSLYGLENVSLIGRLEPKSWPSYANNINHCN